MADILDASLGTLFSLQLGLVWHKGPYVNGQQRTDESVPSRPPQADVSTLAVTVSTELLPLPVRVLIH